LDASPKAADRASALHVRNWHLTDLKAGTDDVCLGVQTGPRDTIALDVLLTQSRRRGLGTARPELYAQQRHGIIQRSIPAILGEIVNVLIVYGTTEGQTRKIAERVAKGVSDRGHSVELHDSLEPDAGLDLETFHAFVLAGSVHQEQHQKAIKNFATAHSERLNASPAAFVSVSLSAALEETRSEAQSYVDRFVSLTGWQPRMTLLLGGALRFAEYDYFQEQVVKFIVMRRGLASEDGSDREFTDWHALDSFIDDFLERAES